MYLLGIAIALFAFWFAVTGLGGQWNVFLDTLSLVPTVGLIAAALTATNSFKVFSAGMKAVIFPAEELSDDMRGRAASLFRLLSKLSVIGGAMGFFLTTTLMLDHLDWSHPNAASAFGANFSAALSIPLYSLFFVFAVFEPAVFILKKRSSKGN